MPNEPVEKSHFFKTRFFCRIKNRKLFSVICQRRVFGYGNMARSHLLKSFGECLGLNAEITLSRSSINIQLYFDDLLDLAHIFFREQASAFKKS